LENLSGDPDQEYVADGMTEELIGELAKLGSLNVISRTSVMRYKQRTQSIPEIAAELGVDGVLEGTVTREQDRFRVTVQLIDARTDMHLWADQFDRELSSVLALRADVARAVAEQIRLELTPEEETALASPRRVNPRAYDAYLRGLQLVGPIVLASAWAPPALEQFERAVALDPGFAEAWVRVSLAQFFLGRIEKSREAVERALELNDHLPAAHAALATVRDAEWDFAGARRAAERAFQLSPNDPDVLQVYKVSLLRHGRLAEALRVSERIALVAPLDTFFRAQHTKDIYSTRHYEQTLEAAERVRVLIPDFYDLEEAWAYAKLGRLYAWYGTQLALFEQCGKPCDPIREARERGWAEGGPAGAVRAWIDVSKDTPGASPFFIAVGYALLGETDEALA
jgi:TolB-like protein